MKVDTPTEGGVEAARASSIEAEFRGRTLLVLGAGAVATAVLGLLRQHVGVRPEQVLVLAPEGEGLALAPAQGFRVRRQALTRDNCAQVLEEALEPGDMLLNLASCVSSLELVAWCQRREVLYVDTSNEVWPSAGGAAPMLTCERREAMGALRSAASGTAATAVVGHGCNPGLVSHFCKQALLEVQARLGPPSPAPRGQEEWAALAARLRVRTIHVAERDSQHGPVPMVAGGFVNTWSVESMLEEMMEAPNFANGTHEEGARGAVRRLPGHAALSRVRSWEPEAGSFIGAVVPHSETFTLADYLTGPGFRPTVLFAYQPCPHGGYSLLDSAGRDFAPPRTATLLREEIERGGDNVGILLFCEGLPGAYWYGSRLSIQEARRVARHTNATALQVAAGALGAVVWALRNPRRGLCEPEALEHELVLRVARPYLGELGGTWSPWRPSERLQLEDFLVA